MKCQHFYFATGEDNKEVPCCNAPSLCGLKGDEVDPICIGEWCLREDRVKDAEPV